MHKRIDLRAWALPVALLAAWWTVTAGGWVDTKLIVPPGSVLRVAAKTLVDPLFWQGVLFSVARDASGFALGAMGGVVLGGLLGASRRAERLIGPSFHALRQVSLFAWLPLLSTWFGYGETAKLVFIALSALYPVTLGTFEGVRSVSLQHAEVARVYRFTRTQRVFRLLLPAAGPQIATGLTLGLVSAWVATIGSEFLLANWGNGLGNIIIRGRSAFNVELIVVGMLAIGLVGGALSHLAGRIESRVLHVRAPH
ncbi:MAG TPA: ABC transporter permease [Albitalea sp.]|uniref:ABC transporter permease n=1 Tax=Piscinibacter sp. TaxID=1903157 RepID=UPI002ED56EBE